MPVLDLFFLIVWILAIILFLAGAAVGFAYLNAKSSLVVFIWVLVCAMLVACRGNLEFAPFAWLFPVGLMEGIRQIATWETGAAVSRGAILLWAVYLCSGATFLLVESKKLRRSIWAITLALLCLNIYGCQPFIAGMESF